MEFSADLTKFLETYPPTSTQPADPEIISRYENVLPEILLELWREHGFGTYGNGLFQLINPDEYRETLNTWVSWEGDGKRIPFAMAAFGEMFYWRHIYNPEPSEDFPEWVFDASYFNPHNSQTGLCAYTMDEFFGDYIVDPEIIAALKWQDHSGYSVDLIDNALEGHENPESTLFEKALKKLGILQLDEMYYFVPALRLGGIDDIEYVDKGNAFVQLDILYQLTEDDPGGYVDDRFDYYSELDGLGDNPADYDRRISELKNSMDGTNDAESHYLIGMILNHYPVWHESIVNYEDVSQRTSDQAVFHHNKAKELAPDVAKYHYAAYYSNTNNFQNKNWDAAEADIQKYYDLSGDEDTYLRSKLEIAKGRNAHDQVMQHTEELFNLLGDYNDLTSAAYYFDDSGDYETAESLFRRVFSESSDYHTASAAATGLAGNYLNQKKSEAKILPIFDELQQKFPEQKAEIFNSTGNFFKSAHWQKGNLEKAVTHYQKAIDEVEKAGADNFWLGSYYANLSSAYSEMQNFEAAKAAIEKAIEFGDSADYQYDRTQLLLKMGLEDEARESAANPEEFDQKYRDSSNWQEIVWSLQSSPVAFDNKIEIVEKELAKNPADAEKQFLLAKLFENYPVYAMPADEQENQNSYVANGGFAALCEATDLEPDNAEYQLELANFLYNQHHYVEIEDETRDDLMRRGYQYYIDHAENPYKGYDGLARMAMYNDDWEEIIKYSKLAYEADPANTDHLSTLGDAYRQLGRFPEAMNAYQEYIQSHTESYGINYGKRGLAETYISMGEKGRARSLIEDLADAAAEDETRAEAYHTGSEAFRMHEDYQAALEFQQKAVEFANSTNNRHIQWTHLFSLSDLYENLGNHAAAADIMQELSKTRGEAYDFYFLAKLRKELGQTDEARKAVKRALEMEPNDQMYQELLDELGQGKKGGLFGKWF